MNSCCSPVEFTPDRPAASPVQVVGRAPIAAIEAVEIPGGQADIGTPYPLYKLDGEGAVRTVAVNTYRLGVSTVTTEQFSDFVAATGYVTDAELLGWSFVFHLQLQDADQYQAVVGATWWKKVEGTSWKAPSGPAGPTSSPGDPVVHVSWNDATRFAAWAGGRLPTEGEWEHAARGGLRGVVYPWGNEAPDDKHYMPCNIWQGTFPDRNLGTDGFPGLAPARSFAPNGYGLFNMCGNCWEWTADRFKVRSLAQGTKERNIEALKMNMRLLKGGSYLCHASYCHRYRIAARIGNTPDASTGHMGFRIAFD
jgi:sulfatase modifying factor 1